MQPMPTTMSSLQLTLTVCITTGIGILYPWMLPSLAIWGFAERGSDSVSEYIANAHATGAMAVATAGPLYWIVRFQETFVSPETPHSRWLWTTQRLFLVCYGAFLINTVTWSPFVHFVVVGLFCVVFLLHAVAVVRCVVPSWSATVCLGVGGIAFVSLLFAPGQWFWAVECVGLSAMMLFTPIELFVARRHRLNALDETTTKIPDKSPCSGLAGKIECQRRSLFHPEKR